jgi:putative ABC transport system permease protein
MARRTRFRGLFGPDPQADVDEELAFHLEMRSREYAARGERDDQAREHARSRLGDLEAVRRECIAIATRSTRRMARFAFLSNLAQDVTFALRLLRRTPLVACTAILTLGLGIGATTAIFSVVHGVLLQPLPYTAAHRLYDVHMRYPDGAQYSLSAPDFMSVRQQAQALEYVGAFTDRLDTLLEVGEPREVRVARVSDGLLTQLGTTLRQGRAFVADEHQPGRGQVVVLAHAFWQQVLGGDPQVIGRRLTFADGSREVVGVLAPGVQLPEPADIYQPLTYGPTFDPDTAQGRRSEFLTVVGRAREGSDTARVRADIGAIGRRLQQAFPDTNTRLDIDARPLVETVVGDVRTPLLMLLGAVGFVWLVACANVAHLLLARVSSRRAELGVRAALGATRGRILTQLLVESSVLGTLGGLLGLLIAQVGIRVLVAAEPADIPRLDEVAMSWPVIGAGLLGTVVASALLGLLPAWQATGLDLATALREGGRDAGASGGSRRVRAMLVVAEVGLAVVLLTGAGLFVRSLVALSHVDPGFRPDRVSTFRVTLTGPSYADDAAVRQRVDALQERLGALPGVQAVAATSTLPLSGRGAMHDFAVEGQPPPPPNVNGEIAVASVTPGYFDAIGMRLLRGRSFDDRDGEAAPRVAVINEAGVRQWFGGADPVGLRVVSGTTREIVGVVADVAQRSLAEPAVPQLFVPYAQRSTRSVRVVVRGSGAATEAQAIRAAVQTVDPRLPISDVTPLGDVITTSLARTRFYTALLALFAGVGLALAATGVFGVMSYAVSQRAQEMGIRLALGAVPAAVLRLVVRQSLGLTGTGLVAGLIGAVLLARTIRQQLYAVTPLDPVTLAIVAATLTITAVVASLGPARRAARLDPARSMRAE